MKVWLANFCRQNHRGNIYVVGVSIAREHIFTIRSSRHEMTLNWKKVLLEVHPDKRRGRQTPTLQFVNVPVKKANGEVVPGHATCGKRGDVRVYKTPPRGILDGDKCVSWESLLAWAYKQRPSAPVPPKTPTRKHTGAIRLREVCRQECEQGNLVFHWQCADVGGPCIKSAPIALAVYDGLPVTVNVDTFCVKLFCQRGAVCPRQVANHHYECTTLVSWEQAAKGKKLRLWPIGRKEIEVFLKPPLLPGNAVTMTRDGLEIRVNIVCG